MLSRRIVVFMSVVMCALCVASSICFGATNKKAKKVVLRKKLSTVTQQIKQKQAQIRQVRKTKAVVHNQLKSIQSKLNTTRHSILTTHQKLVIARREYQAKKAALDATKKRLKKRQSILGQRIRASYRMGNTGYISALLRAKSMNQLVSRGYVIGRIARYDNILISGIRSDIADAQKAEQALAVKNRQIASLEQQLSREAVTLKSKSNQKYAALDDVKSQQAELEQALNELEEVSHQITSSLRAMEQTPVGRRMAKMQFKGGFMRPVSGRVSSSFGMRKHPILGRVKLHTGVDLASGYGTPIHAAASGVVVYASYMRAYGNTVMINHGGGVTTLYGHCSSLNVRTGQDVKQGQVIARVGATGYATGPHLHFEVRRHGSPVCPPF